MAGDFYTVVRRFSNNYFSCTQLKHNLKGIKIDFYDSDEKLPPIWSASDLEENDATEDERNTEKFHESLVRARTRIFEIAVCNNWEHFCTFTIDPQKYDRYNLSLFYKDFSQYICNLNKRYDYAIKYLLIPEMHKDGAWHLHGLMSGIPKTQLRNFNLNEKLPRYIRDKLKIGFHVYDWCSYSSRFGFCDIERIRNLSACCKYIVKYVTKDLGRSVKGFGAKLYYCSRGLNRPVVVYEGFDAERIGIPDFSNFWMERKDFFTFASALEYSNVQFYDSFINSDLDEDTIYKILAG